MESAAERDWVADPPILADQGYDPAALEGRFGTLDRDEAAHWVAVYEELIGVCRQFLETDLRSPTCNPDRVRARLRHFEGRQRYWRDVHSRPQPPSE